MIDADLEVESLAQKHSSPSQVHESALPSLIG